MTNYFQDDWNIPIASQNNQTIYNAQLQYHKSITYCNFLKYFSFYWFALIYYMSSGCKIQYIFYSNGSISDLVLDKQWFVMKKLQPQVINLQCFVKQLQTCQENSLLADDIAHDISQHSSAMSNIFTFYTETKFTTSLQFHLYIKGTKAKYWSINSFASYNIKHFPSEIKMLKTVSTISFFSKSPNRSFSIEPHINWLFHIILLS